METTARQWRWRRGGGGVMLAILLFVLAGCAAGGKPQAAPGDGERAATGPVDKGSAVTRLADGREGFIIRETSRLDSAGQNEFERAVVLLQQDDYAQAAELLEKVIERSPGVSAPYINLAIACRHLHRLPEAEAHLQTALGLVPAHPVASNEYGLLLRQTGRFAEAREVFEKTLTAFPEYLPARRNLGILCDLYLDDLACALEQYEIYHEAVPGDGQVGIWVADLRLRLGR